MPPLMLADPLLGVAAEILDDIEKTLIANQNRLRSLTRTVADADGEKRGYGLPDDHPDVLRTAGLLDHLVKAEHEATLNLERRVRAHPLGPWAKAQRGVGSKQFGRLLAAVGDPYWNTLYDRPRTVSELWAYSGYRPGQRREKGRKDKWSAAAKMRAFNIAESTVKQLVAPCAVVKGETGEYLYAVHVDGCGCSPYRRRYDKGRDLYRGSVHPEVCARCGPKGNPALVGSPRSAAHIHQLAIRLATKGMLKDLWCEAKRLHDLHDSHRCLDTQQDVAVVDPPAVAEAA